MRNPILNQTILRILSRLDTTLKESTLRAETELAIDRPITTDEFQDAIDFLADNDLVSSWRNLMGDRVWAITDTGKDALKGI